MPDDGWAEVGRSVERTVNAIFGAAFAVVLTVAGAAFGARRLVRR